jgi:spermidine synthase
VRPDAAPRGASSRDALADARLGAAAPADGPVPAGGSPAIRPVSAYLIVFVTSACTLVLEIVAGRLLAPYIGVSLFTWTSVIGVVLAGLSVGNYLGGQVADRAGSRRMLGTILVAGGIASLAVLPLLASGAGAFVPRTYPVMLRIVALTAVLFFVPSLILGMVSPLVVKLTLADLARAGNLVGKIYAWSAVGSIAGTFLTGFVLIAYLGSRTVVLAVGLTLLVLGLAAGDFIRRGGRLAGLALAVLLAASFVQIHSYGALGSDCDRETAYYCIRVEDDEEVNGQPLKRLVLDHLIHGYTALDDPTYLHYDYLQTYAELTDYVAQTRPALRALFIGGGAYTLPRYLEARYPDATIEVSEIDPGVTATVHERLGLARDTRVRTQNADAREVVEAKQGGPAYDLVFGDAFNDYQVPYHLTTREFAAKIRGIMRDDGVYLVLVIDRMRGGRFMASMVRTLQTVFPHVYVLEDPGALQQGYAATHVIAASGTPLDERRLATVTGRGRAGERVARVLPPAAMEAWLAASRPVLLTDDHAPVDNLMAPVFLERGF